MKQVLTFFVVYLSTLAGVAQPSAMSSESMQDPITSVMRSVLYRQANNLIALAEQMPKEKYSYRPTLQQQSFAQLMTDIISTNNSFCSTAGGVLGPTPDGLKQIESKEKIVAALKSSFTLCKTTLERLHDNQLGDTVPFSREADGPRGAALLMLLDAWADSYQAAFICFRLNRIEPPEKEPEFAPRPKS